MEQRLGVDAEMVQVIDAESDPFEAVRGQDDMRKFQVSYPLARALEFSIGQYLEEERLLAGPTSEAYDLLDRGKPILKAFRRGKPIGFDNYAGTFREVELSLSGQQIVDLNDMVGEISRATRQNLSPWAETLVQNLVDQYPMAQSTETARNPLRGVWRIFARQEG